MVQAIQERPRIQSFPDDDARTVLVGMNNPRTDYAAHTDYALFPLPEISAGGRLFAMIRDLLPTVRRVDFLSAFRRENLVWAPVWDRTAAQVRGEELRTEFGRTGRRVVLFGRQVQRAYLGESYDEIRGLESHTWVNSSGGSDQVILLPHPSGRTRDYNDEATRSAVSNILLNEFIRGWDYVSNLDREIRDAHFPRLANRRLRSHGVKRWSL